MASTPVPDSAATAATKRFLPWVVATALFMEQLDSTIVNTGIPAIAQSLNATPLSLKAVVTSYIVALAVSIPVSGWLADIDEDTFYKWQRRASDTIATILWEVNLKLTEGQPLSL